MRQITIMVGFHYQGVYLVATVCGETVTGVVVPGGCRLNVLPEFLPEIRRAMVSRAWVERAQAISPRAELN